MARHLFDLDALGAGLTVSAAAEELTAAAATGAAVVIAPPGTGKTTFVPPLLANLLGDQGRVLLVEPRRIAVRAAARRIAVLDGSELGGPSGFTVRGERRASRHTQIEALTPGVLLRRLLTDPGLDGVAAVILDEVHERSVESDLLLAMLAEVRELRADLCVLAMSATLQAERISEVLGNAPVVDIPSPLHPLRIDYVPFTGARLDTRGITDGYLQYLADVTLAAQATEHSDALVFVPSTRDVDVLVRLLRDRASAATPSSPLQGSPSPVEVLPLHGRIPAREQDRVVSGRRPREPHRIVVSTALAESSLTVPGISLVIDSGLAREVRRDRSREMSGLVTVSASRASAEQRGGRAARLGPGRVVRAYSEAEYAHMPSSSQAEIASADLVDAALLLAVWGTPEGRGLALPSPPPKRSMELAAATLSALGLIDGEGRPTRLGTLVAAMPTGAREGRALLAGARSLGDARAAAEAVAMLSDDQRVPGADADQLLRELKSGRHAGSRRWRIEVGRLEHIAAKQLGAMDLSDAMERPNTGEEQQRVEPSDAGSGLPGVTKRHAAGEIIALARPEWIARRTGEQSRSYLLASGSRAALPPGSPLADHEWLAVYEVQRVESRIADGTGAVIRLAAGLPEEQALQLAGPLLKSTRVATIVDGRVRVREERRLGSIVLNATPAAALPEDTGPALLSHVRAHGLNALPWNEQAQALRNRLGLLHRVVGEPWPDMGDNALLAQLETWLAPQLAGVSPSASLERLDTHSALKSLLPWPEAAQLDDMVPERLRVPSGSTVLIAYPAPESDAPPTVSVKLQEVFGLSETPRLVNGRIPVLFHLLSPARRPLAVTDDLASFWDGPYRQVRAEMRGRYPKHPWPEDPWSAEATALTKRAAGRSRPTA